MARGTTDTRRLIKFSNYSMCVTLPKWVIDQLEWQKGDQLTLVTDVKQGKITLFRDNQPTSQLKPAQSKPSETAPPPKLRW